RVARVDRVGRRHGRGRGRGRGRLSRQPRGAARSYRRAAAGVAVTALFEGVGIALASLRAHKMRAALTILGVAIGVTVVMVIGALISGINKGISDMLSSLGPKTFWVGRYRSEEHTSELQSQSNLVCRL